MSVDFSKIQELLGGDADTLLNHVSKTIPKDVLQLPGGDFVDRVWGDSGRTPAVLRSLQTLQDNGRLRGTRESSTRPGQALHRTRNISTRPTS
jgi:class I fructose-bisphosphate aldolase